MVEAQAKGEADSAAAQAAKDAEPVIPKRAEARKGSEGSRATAILGGVRSARLQENQKKVRDERRRAMSRVIQPSVYQLAKFRADLEVFGAGVDAQRWAHGTAESFELFGGDSSENDET